MYQLSFLMAPPAGGAGGQASNPILSMLPLVLMFVILYFLMIRPQQKKQKELKKMIAEMKKGDKVVMSGGIHGIIAGMKDNTVLIKVADNVKIEFSKSAVVSVEKGKEGDAE